MTSLSRSAVMLSHAEVSLFVVRLLSPLQLCALCSSLLASCPPCPGSALILALFLVFHALFNRVALRNSNCHSMQLACKLWGNPVGLHPAYLRLPYGTIPERWQRKHDPHRRPPFHRLPACHVRVLQRFHATSAAFTQHPDILRRFADSACSFPAFAWPPG
jgi:hypothetical protein